MAMPTRKCDKAVQTGTGVVQQANSETQTGFIFGQLTTSAVSQPGSPRGKLITPFSVPFEPDNFGWYEEGTATQTSPTWQKMSKLTQTPAPKNGRKMLRARSSSIIPKAQKRRSEEEQTCQGTAQ